MPKYQVNYTGDEKIDFITVGEDKPSAAEKKEEKKSQEAAGLSKDDAKIVESIDAGIETDEKPADEEKKPATRKAAAAKKADEK